MLEQVPVGIQLSELHLILGLLLAPDHFRILPAAVSVLHDSLQRVQRSLLLSCPFIDRPHCLYVPARRTSSGTGEREQGVCHLEKQVVREGAELLQADEGNVGDPPAASGGAELVVDGAAAEHDAAHLVWGHQVRLACLRVPGPMPSVVRGLQQC